MGAGDPRKPVAAEYVRNNASAPVQQRLLLGWGRGRRVVQGIVSGPSAMGGKSELGSASSAGLTLGSSESGFRGLPVPHPLSLDRANHSTLISGRLCPACISPVGIPPLYRLLRVLQYPLKASVMLLRSTEALGSLPVGRHRLSALKSSREPRPWRD